MQGVCFHVKEMHLAVERLIEARELRVRLSSISKALLSSFFTLVLSLLRLCVASVESKIIQEDACKSNGNKARSDRAKVWRVSYRELRPSFSRDPHSIASL